MEQAIQSLGYQIFSPTWIESGEECGSDQWAGYSSQVSARCPRAPNLPPAVSWHLAFPLRQFVDMGDGNAYCMMLYNPTVDGRCHAVTDCGWEVASVETIDPMQDKYGLNMAAHHCAKDGTGAPDAACRRRI